MDKPLILSLDAHGVPHRWISWQQACFYYAKNLIAWTMGDETFTYYGGISRITGERSSITAHSIIAIKGKALAAKGFNQVPPLNNRELFRRDRHMCAYCLRPEVHPLEESGPGEQALHAALMAEPRRKVAQSELDAVEDADARDNYRVVLRFRDRLLEAGTVEACYMSLFKAPVDLPPLFVEQMVHVILRNILDDCADPLRLRAAELFFREQKATIQEG